MGTAASLATTMVVAPAAPASAAKPAEPPAASPGPSVRGVREVTPKVPSRPKPVPAYRPTRTAFPKAATAEVAVPAATTRAASQPRARVAGMPVWVAPADKPGAGGSRLSVRLLDRSATDAAGVAGVLLALTPAEDGPAAGPVHVGVDYRSFAEAYGGNYGSRLRLVRFPNCVLTTPKLPACRSMEPLRSTNDSTTSTVSAETTLDANGPTVLAAVASTGEEGGNGGTYAATDLKPSGSWSGGGSTGSFTYSYPITVPPAASDLVPAVALSYDSGSVDGQTASTNAQSSWVGDGWSMPQSYVEQTFASCKDDLDGGSAPVKTPDQCYNGEILTISLNGRSSSLVWDRTKAVWKPESDNGAVVTRIMNSGNNSGTEQEDYWRVVERDGTVYEFGRNRLPGWTSGKPETKSVNHVPVYSPNSGGPCYNSAGFSSSWCTMAYRWNLDYVKDVHGNAMAFYYGQDANYYGRYNGATDTPYIRDSHLTRIDYGFTDGNAYGTAPNRVVFNTDVRCLSGTCEPLNSTTKANWPDVPYDLVCESGTDCTSWGPSFFSTVRLASIETQQYNTSTAKHERVDLYELSQAFKPTGDGTSPVLWLSSVKRTGSDTSAGGSTTPITLPEVSFTEISLPNRADAVTSGLPEFRHPRIATITTETGSVISASYELPRPCTNPSTLDPATNTTSCYPVYWTPDGLTNKIRDWFYKWAVTRVTSTDPVGGALALSTSYEYVGGAAWRYDENEVVKAKYRTYGQFRGYGTVKTRTGDGVNDRRTLNETTYYRGMSRNNNTTVVNVTDSAGGVHEDLEELAGSELESTSYQGDGGPVESSTVTSYWVSSGVATRARTGLPALTSKWVEPVKTYTRQRVIAANGDTTWRYTATENSYDVDITSVTFGELKHTYTHTVPTNAAYDQCVSHTYAPVNTSKNVAGLVSQTETVAVACGGFTEGSPPSVPGSMNTLTAPATVNRPEQVVAVERTFYDDQTTFSTTFPQATPPTKGDVTMTRVATDWTTAGGYAFETSGRSTYDGYGRVVDSYDAKGNKSTTTYTMNAVGLTTATSSKNALNHDTRTTVNPRRGLIMTITDPNNVVTRQQYDALGRSTAVWLHNRTTSSPADQTFSYQLSATGPTAVTSRQLSNSNGYRVSTTIYDALLRPRQTQADTPQGGRMVTDTFYDSRGWVRTTYNGWWDDDNPPVVTPNVTALASAADLRKQVNNQTVTTYDGLGRAVVVAAVDRGTTVSTTTTVYNGDRTTVVPPTGGVVTTTVTDPIGRTSELREYSQRPTVSTPADTFTGIFTVSGGTSETSRYGYDERGNQRTLTDSTGTTWTSTYNLLGQVTERIDPDAGKSTMRYDANGNLEEITDARGKSISYTYDALDRKTAQYAATVANQASSNQRAAWVYDNSNKVTGVTKALGRATTATTYRDGRSYISQQKGFDDYGNSLGVTITIPASEGNLGGSYYFGHSYSSPMGLPLIDSYPAKGTLPAESILHGYKPLWDLPDTLGSAAGAYVNAVSYDAWGRVNQQQLGATAPNIGHVTRSYDPHTGRLASQLVTRQGTTPTNVDEQRYDYDLAGNITRRTSTRLDAATASETQCFGYDGLARLTEAWTATDNCAITPTPGDRSMVGNNIGGGSAYWTSWSIDSVGNRTQEIERDLTGGTDTTTTYAYNGNNAGQPHTLTSTDTTGGATRSTSYTYDAAGNMVTRKAGQGNQTLTWDDAGNLTDVTGSGGGDSTFVYDDAGNLLLQREPGKTTLYLPGQQLTLDTATGAVTGQRYYTLPGGGTAIRTGSGSSYTFGIPDHQGTPGLYLDSTAQTPTWRMFTPYGAPRGAAITAPDNRGFLNKPMSETSGLTMVGARSYDPSIGKFISTDPVQDAGQPQQWNGYSYANNTPITKSDPTGMIPSDCREFDCYGYDPKKGCPHGCGTTKNKEWGRKHHKGSTKSRRGKYVPPKRPTPAPGKAPGPGAYFCGTVFLNGSCLPSDSPALRPGNLANGSTYAGLDWGMTNGTGCTLHVQQIICFGGSPAGNRPMTVGDVLLYPGDENALTDELDWQTREWDRISNTCDAAGRCLDPAVFGPDLLAHEAAHSDQWAKEKTGNKYMNNYVLASADSYVRCGDPGDCNKYEVGANPFKGGYWHAPVVLNGRFNWPEQAYIRKPTVQKQMTPEVRANLSYIGLM